MTRDSDFGRTIPVPIEELGRLARLVIDEGIRDYRSLKAVADEAQAVVDRYDDPDDKIREWIGITWAMPGKVEDALAEAIVRCGHGRSSRGIAHESSLYAATPDDEGTMQLTVIALANIATLAGEPLG